MYDEYVSATATVTIKIYDAGRPDKKNCISDASNTRKKDMSIVPGKAEIEEGERERKNIGHDNKFES